jgi:preprotein translocase subunit SecA
MLLPTYDYQRSNIVAPEKISTGLDSIVHSMVGRVRRRRALLTKLYSDAQQIDAMSDKFTTLSDRKLQDTLSECRAFIRKHSKEDKDCLLNAMAAIREASTRKLGLRPYVVQLVGALALHKGFLAEMATGEGKTLVAGLSAVVSGWTKRPCHVITVNDYLAQRDANWLRPLFNFCHVSVGHIIGSMDPKTRFSGHAQDVTYTTSKEILADFLRDRIFMGLIQKPNRRHIRFVINPKRALHCGLVMRGIHTAIVDEADSILIDEAVTPLIISQIHENSSLKNAVVSAQKIAQHLKLDEHYHLNLRYKEVELNNEATEKIDELCGTLPGIWQASSRRTELIKQALTAREFFHEGKQYVLQDDKVVIVDEFTGRIMPQRTWKQGLHQAIEAKEQMKPSNPSQRLPYCWNLIRTSELRTSP